MTYRDKPQEAVSRIRNECILPHDVLAWFRKWKPELMPFGGWDRLKQLEAEMKTANRGNWHD